MVYSESPSVAFTSINSLFECRDADFTAPAAGPTAEMGGAFYIKDGIGGFTSTSNTYRRCYLADIGGAFHLDNTQLIDTDSQISSNQALQGGAISCLRCKLIDLTRTTIANIEASTSSGQGAAFYIKNPEGPIKLESVQITNA